MLAIFRTFFAAPRHMVLLVIAAWIGLALAENRSELHGIKRGDVNNIVFYGVIAFLIGGRLTFVLQNIAGFAKNPLDLFSINPDVFDPLGALAVAIIAGFVYGQSRGLALWSTLDALTPFAAISSMGVSLSHLAAGTAFGIPTELPWGIELWNATRHPTQIYETVASLQIFILLWLKGVNMRPGMLFLSLISLNAGSQLFIGAFRADSTLILNGLKQEQVLAWLILAGSFFLFEARFNSSTPGKGPADRQQKRAQSTRE